MTTRDVDIVVLGSGFGGSLLSLILNQLDYRVALIDKGSHPRFAIGESSTPLADFVLSDLARRYDLPEVLPLASYGTWLKRYPGLNCGLKRGFSYFHHRAGEPFTTDDRNKNQLLVAASSNDTDSDTHWYRADVDLFLFELARSKGVECLDNTTVDAIRGGDLDGREQNRWQVELHNTDAILRPRYIIDASGPARVFLNEYGYADLTHQLHTRTRATYGHFENVRTFAGVLAESGIGTARHPYACDNAALHHVGKEGWMWNLRFRDGMVSAGVVTKLEKSDRTAEGVWQDWLTAYPSIAHQFADAVGTTSLIQTARLQRLAASGAGTGWFALPNTVGFVDPLHSTGIAHTLSAVERIAALFEARESPKPDSYARAIPDELRFIDRLVSGCVGSLGYPELFAAWCMVYFAAAHSCEMRRVRGESCFSNGFLGANIDELRQRIDRIHQEFHRSAPEPQAFNAVVTDAIAPYNEANLFAPAEPNMYANTAPPRNLGGTD